MKILLLAEHDNEHLKPATHHTMTAAAQLGDDIHVLIAGHDCESVAKEAAAFKAVKKVLLLNSSEFSHPLAENIAPLIAELGKQYDTILTAATTFGKNILPRAAALLDLSMIADVIKIISADTFERPLYAGNAIIAFQERITCAGMGSGWG